MKISLDNALGIHDDALMLRARRAEVLASNLANTDTPNYKARDFDFHEVLANQQELLASQRGLEMNTTRSGHIPGGATLRHDADLDYRVPLQPSIDGNTVEEQVELGEFMRNSMEFQANFTFLNSKFRGLTTALRGE